MMPSYTGRFAPSPTGPLHFGSLVAAVASYADARHHQGRWLVRIEDVDEGRRRDEAEEQILHMLRALGMHWDAAPERQSERKTHYADHLARLIESDRAFRCNCSRKQIANSATVGLDGPVYPGTCRRRPPPEQVKAAWRAKVDTGELGFTDRILGPLSQNLGDDIGDFIIQRIDGYFAYQLAVVVDDQLQGVTHVVRGQDLLVSTPRQIWLQRQLNFVTPDYAHIPLALGENGKKLSKSEGAFAIGNNDPMPALRRAWHFLGQLAPPFEVKNINDFWVWAASEWQIRRVPQHRIEP